MNTTLPLYTVASVASREASEVLAWRVWSLLFFDRGGGVLFVAAASAHFLRDFCLECCMVRSASLRDKTLDHQIRSKLTAPSTSCPRLGARLRTWRDPAPKLALPVSTSCRRSGTKLRPSFPSLCSSAVNRGFRILSSEHRSSYSSAETLVCFTVSPGRKTCPTLCGPAQRCSTIALGWLKRFRPTRCRSCTSF